VKRDDWKGKSLEFAYTCNNSLTVGRKSKVGKGDCDRRGWAEDVGMGVNGECRGKKKENRGGTGRSKFGGINREKVSGYAGDVARKGEKRGV